MFSPKGEDVILWKLTGQRAFIVDYHAEDSSQITPEIVREDMRDKLEGIAENIAQSDPLSENQTFSGILQHVGGKKELFSVSEKVTAVIRDRASILGIEANALRVANIMNQLGVCSCKVTKELYLRGVHYEPREYTGYFL